MLLVVEGSEEKKSYCLCLREEAVEGYPMNHCVDHLLFIVGVERKGGGETCRGREKGRCNTATRQHCKVPLQPDIDKRDTREKRREEGEKRKRISGWMMHNLIVTIKLRYMLSVKTTQNTDDIACKITSDITCNISFVFRFYYCQILYFCHVFIKESKHTTIGID